METPHPQVDDSVLSLASIRKLKEEFKKTAILVEKSINNDIHMIGKDIPRLCNKINVKIDYKDDGKLDPCLRTMLMTSLLCEEEIDFEKTILKYQDVNKNLHQEITEFAKTIFSHDKTLVLLVGKIQFSKI